jgi:hypothetical protein
MRGIHRPVKAKVKRIPKPYWISVLTHQYNSILLSALMVLASFSGGPAPPWQATEAVPTLTVCAALRHRTDYDGHIVRIRDRATGTDEYSGFISDACPGILVTDRKVWPSSIAWTMPRSKDTILHPVDFSFDEESQKQLTKKWVELSKRVPDRCIEVTYTGMFEVWSKSKARRPLKGGWQELPGFGHLNGWGAQLVLKSADDVSVIPNCK